MWKVFRRIKESLLSNAKNKSYQKKYACYYVAVVVIPITILMLTNLISQEEVKSQVIQSNERTLKQFFKSVDEQIALIEDDIYKAAVRKELKEYAELEAKESVLANLQRKDIFDLLKEHYNTGYYEDVFVWFPYSDRVLSGINPMPLSSVREDYFKTYYEKEQEISQTIIGNLQNTPMKLVYWPIELDGEPNFALSVNRYHESSELKNYALTVIISNTFLQDFIGDGILAQEENAMLFNGEGELLFSYQTEGIDHLPEHCRGTGIYEINEKGERLTLLVQNSKSMSGYYAMAIAEDMFFRPLVKIRVISYLGSFFSIFIGLSAAYQMSRNTYRPLGELMKKLQEIENKQFDSSIHSEFEFMTDWMLDKRVKEDKLEVSRQKELDFVRKKQLLLIALENKDMSEQDVDFLEEQMDFSKRFYGGIFLVENCEKSGWNLVPFMITNILKEIFRGIGGLDVLSLSINRHVFLLSLNETVGAEEVRGRLEEGLNILEKHLGVRIVAGVGEECYGLFALHKIYYQAQRALHYRFILEKERIIYYHQVRGRQMAECILDKDFMLQRVDDFLVKENVSLENCEVFVKKLAESFGIDCEASIETIESFRYEIISTLNRVWAGTEITYFQRQEFVEQLMQEEYFTGYLKRLSTILLETRNNKKSNSRRQSHAGKIKQYIEENYANPDMSVSLVGEVLDMKGTYLSQIFRDEYGISVLNYVSNIMIKEAQRMLRETKKSIHEIGESVGFLSDGVFIKAFKKTVGVTPGKYREERG